MPGGEAFKQQCWPCSKNHNIVLHAHIFAECTPKLESNTTYTYDENSVVASRPREIEDIESCKYFCASQNVKFFVWHPFTCWCKIALDPAVRRNCSTCVSGEAYCENDETDARWRDREREHVVGFEWLTR